MSSHKYSIAFFITPPYSTYTYERNVKYITKLLYEQIACDNDNPEYYEYKVEMIKGEISDDVIVSATLKPRIVKLKAFL